MAGRRRKLCRGLVTVLVMLASVSPAWGGPDGQDKTDQGEMEQLREQMKALSQEVQQLRKERDADRQRQDDHQRTLAALSRSVEDVKDLKWMDAESWLNKFHLGGYGEMHATLGEGDSSEQFDLHRLVLYLGYDFNDWIKFHSEIELEHGFVSSSSGGEVVAEQLYVDFLLSDRFNVRVGRVLTPLGIINAKHEPPSFLGVERPLFATNIIPSTWSSDGAGVFGALTPWLKYEAYVVGGLDGSQFSATTGIRGGRIKERPSLHEPAVTGRVDFYPFVGRQLPYDQDLRIGLSTYFGGLDNGNRGDDPDIDGKIHIYSADFDYSIAKFDFRGVVAYETIDGAGKIGGGVAEGIFGFYTQGGYHFMPKAWKKGKLKDADAVAFLRFDSVDTQHSMPSGVAKNPAGTRTEWTMGVNFYLTPKFVLKADYQVRDDDSSEGLDNILNLGVGWEF